MDSTEYANIVISSSNLVTNKKLEFEKNYNHLDDHLHNNIHSNLYQSCYLILFYRFI